MAAKLPRKYQEDCLRGAKRIYLATSKREARKRFLSREAEWEKLAPKAVSCIKDNLDELLNFLDCPQEHWVKIRTTNAIERAFREVRRRTRPMSCFNTARSVDRIIFGVLSHLNNAWRKKPLPQFTHRA